MSNINTTPSLYISNFSYSIPKFERELAEDFGKTFNIKYLESKIRLQFDNVDSFKKFKLALNEGKVPYFTFSLNTERPLTMVVKGLLDIPAEEILYELKSKGLNPTSCSLMGGRDRNGPSNYALYRVNFPPGTAPNIVSKVNAIFSTRIYWEKFY